MEDIFRQIDEMNLELPDSKCNNCSEDKIKELEKKLNSIQANEYTEFRQWAEKYVFDLEEKIYLGKNFKLMIAEYVAFLTEFYPNIITMPDAAMKIAFGAFVYGYYAGKVKNYEI